MENENVKIFNVRGEYRMSEDDSFKTAKNFALESAEKNLDAEVKHFLHEKFPNLDDNDIFEISEKFLKKAEPRFIRENLPNNEMICYAELDAKINLIDLNKFMENFAVFKLEKKVEDLQNEVDRLSVKFQLLEENLLYIINYTDEIKIDSYNADAYYNRGCRFYEIENYEQAAEDLEKAIDLKPSNAGAYLDLGNIYYELGRYDEAIPVFEKYAQLTDVSCSEILEKCYEALKRKKEFDKFLEEYYPITWKIKIKKVL